MCIRRVVCIYICVCVCVYVLASNWKRRKRVDSIFSYLIILNRSAPGECVDLYSRRRHIGAIRCPRLAVRSAVGSLQLASRLAPYGRTDGRVGIVRSINVIRHFAPRHRRRGNHVRVHQNSVRLTPLVMRWAEYFGPEDVYRVRERARCVYSLRDELSDIRAEDIDRLDERIPIADHHTQNFTTSQQSRNKIGQRRMINGGCLIGIQMIYSTADHGRDWRLSW